MNAQEKNIYAVPTNIITGFLGVGKTTLILNLLKQKPEDERWAILVNEFGEVGVDGSLIQGRYGDTQGVFIREVPGGCMCCAAGLPMQIALNQLLTRAKPDRLLIEPTGLGHPKEVLEVLSADYYREILDVQQCITLVDARKLADTRYTEHNTFNQQIDMADIIIGHKTDLYHEGDQQKLIDYSANRHQQTVPTIFAVQGNIEISMLNGKSTVINNLRHHRHKHMTNLSSRVGMQDIPESGFLKIENSGEGYQSIGWRFSPDKVFNRSALFNWLSGLHVERAKGVFITNEGVFGYNFTVDTMTEMELDDCIESRIEIVAHGENHANQEGLFLCIEN